MPSAPSALKHAHWLNRQRVSAYSLILLIASVCGALLWVALSRGMIDQAGKPLGTDFLSFYAAGKLALSGHAADAWVPERHAAAQIAVFNQDLGYAAFFYPPPYLLVCTGFAWLGYAQALTLWTVATFTGAVFALREWVRKIAGSPQGLIVILGFPALWINMGNGQNAALTTAIMAMGCLWLDKRPWLAGAVLGLLVIKPQLAVALPFVLLAAGRWQTVAAMGASAICLCGLSFLAFPEVWPAFLHNAGLARATLEQGLVEPYKMQSLFAALRLWGAPLGFAYAAQTVWAAGILGTACLVAHRSRPDACGLGAIMVAASLMISPFLLDYDLCLSAIPIGWLLLSGLKTGFRPYEVFGLFCAYLLPLVARNAAQFAGLPLTPLVSMALFLLIARRLIATSSRREVPTPA